MDINIILEQAIKEISLIALGEKFMLKDLFKGYEWNRISQGDRRKLGMLFLNYIESQPQIEVTENPKGQKIYSLKP